jgi:hypothetical protein
VWAGPLRMRTRRVREGFGGDGAAHGSPLAPSPGDRARPEVVAPPASPPVDAPGQRWEVARTRELRGKPNYKKAQAVAPVGNAPAVAPRARASRAPSPHASGPGAAGSTLAHLAQPRRTRGGVRFAPCRVCGFGRPYATGAIARRWAPQGAWRGRRVGSLTRWRGSQQPPRRRPHARGRVGARPLATGPLHTRSRPCHAVAAIASRRAAPSWARARGARPPGGAPLHGRAGAP